MVLGTYRLVGWTVDDNKVILNALVTQKCRYRQKSNDFHKFSGEDKTYGFGFYEKPEALRFTDYNYDLSLSLCVYIYYTRVIQVGYRYIYSKVYDI